MNAVLIDKILSHYLSVIFITSFYGYFLSCSLQFDQKDDWYLAVRARFTLKNIY
jgi:hypothetical protein